MKKPSVILTLLLVALSVIIYVLQMTVFHTLRDTAFYFLQDLAFLPLQVAIVTIILERVISTWNRRELLKKINMAISAFFSEAGTDIMVAMKRLIDNDGDIKPSLQVGSNWTGADFDKAMKVLKNTELRIVCQSEDFASMKALLLEKRSFMLRMLENPNLLEHDTFTDMLLAVFHVTEEFIARDEFTCLPSTDTAHLINDTKRALQTLLIQWLNHMEHLHSDYPYLYSLEVRRNPFSDNRSVIIGN